MNAIALLPIGVRTRNGVFSARYTDRDLNAVIMSTTHNNNIDPALQQRSPLASPREARRPYQNGPNNTAYSPVQPIQPSPNSYQGMPPTPTYYNVSIMAQYLGIEMKMLSRATTQTTDALHDQNISLLPFQAMRH